MLPPDRARRRRARRVALSLVLALVVAACGAAAAESSAPAGSCSPARPAHHGSVVVRTTVGGVARDYELEIPPGYDGTSRAPLLLSLHGFTSSIADVDAVTRFPELAGRRGYVVVTPQAPRVDLPVATGPVDVPLWNIAPVFRPRAGAVPGAGTTDDLGYLDGLLDHLESTLCIDTGREYVSGISLGAGMTMALVCERAHRFAAAAPVAGVNLAVTCDAPTATPLIAFHGDADPFVRYQGRDFFGVDVGLPSVERRMAQFAAFGGCAAAPTVSRPDAAVRHLTWTCPSGMAAELYRVVGGAHAWPGAPTPEPVPGTVVTPTAVTADPRCVASMRRS